MERDRDRWETGFLVAQQSACGGTILNGQTQGSAPTGQIRKGENKPFILCFVICTVLFILFNLNYTCFIWISLFLTPFIHGVSSFKINFFLVYTAILCWVVLLAKDFKTQHTISLLQKTNLICIILAALAGLWTFVSVVQKLQLPFGKYTYHFKEHYNTINYFSHTHSTKVPMFFLVKLLGIEYLTERFDTALPLVEYVNSSAVWLLTLFFLITLITFLILTRPVVLRWETPWRFVIFLLYAFASCHILKCLFDGGPFSYDLWPSVMTAHILYHSHDVPSLSATLKRYRWHYVFAILLLCSFTMYMGRSEALLQTVIGVTFFISIYTLFFSGIAVRHVQLKKIILTTTLCCLYGIFYLDLHTVRDAQALMEKIKAGDEVLYYSYPPLKRDNRDIAISNYSKEMAGKRIVDVYRALGENPFRNRRVVIIGRNKNGGTQGYNGCIFRLKVLNNRDTVTLPSNPFIKVHNAIPLSRLGRKDFLIQASFNSRFFPSLYEVNPSTIYQNNKFAILYYLNYYLTSHGITEYVMIPYYYRKVVWD